MCAVPGESEHGDPDGNGQHQKKYGQKRGGVDGHLRRRSSLLPGFLGSLPGKGAVIDVLFRPEEGFHGLVPISAGFLYVLTDSFQIDDGAPQPSDGLHVRDPVFLQLLGQAMDPLGGGVGIGGQGG